MKGNIIMNNHEKKHTFWKEHKDLFMQILDQWLQDNRKTLYYTKDEVYEDYTTLGAGVYDESEDLSSEDGYIAALIKWFDDSLNHGTYTNIVKATCNELKMTYKELGEAIGYSEGALKTAVSTEKISKSMIKAIELYKKTLELEKELENSNKIKLTLKEWLK